MIKNYFCPVCFLDTALRVNIVQNDTKKQNKGMEKLCHVGFNARLK